MNIKQLLSVMVSISFMLGLMLASAGDPVDSMDGGESGPLDSKRIAEIRKALLDQCRTDARCLERNADHLGKTRFEIRTYEEGTLNTLKMVATKIGANLDEDG